MRRRRVYISMPADNWLSTAQNALKWAVVRRIEKLGYASEVFNDPRGRASLSGSRAWSAELAEQVMRRCDGCAVLGFPRWQLQTGAGPVLMPTDYNHYEGALARSLQLPMLVLVQADVQRRVVFDNSFGGYIGTMPAQPTVGWLSTKAFKSTFAHWQNDLALRRDVFLGYCSASAPTAAALKALLQGLGLSVLDWADDFVPGRSILQEIQDAAQRCSCAVFLFTRDDKLADESRPGQVAPRDNVVFEAGYFSAAKGKQRVLIILEAGAKMPADLGGDIYAAMADRNNLDAVAPVLRKFIGGL